MTKETFTKAHGIEWERFDDEYSYPVHFTGTGAVMCEADAPSDVVERLYKVVEEVTGKPVARKAKPKLGFY